MRSKLRVRQRACIGRCTDSRCFKGNANGPLGKKGERSPIFKLGVEMYWLASCVASVDGAVVVVIRPSSKAKINEKSMKN